VLGLQALSRRLEESKKLLLGLLLRLLLRLSLDTLDHLYSAACLVLQRCARFDSNLPDTIIIRLLKPQMSADSDRRQTTSDAQFAHGHEASAQDMQTSRCGQQFG
jgi:hypothetical protein